VSAVTGFIVILNVIVSVYSVAFCVLTPCILIRGKHFGWSDFPASLPPNWFTVKASTFYIIMLHVSTVTVIIRQNFYKNILSFVHFYR
jgi:hypothetical protein